MLLRALGKDDLPLIMKVEKICFPDEKWREEDYLNEIEHNPFAHYYGLLNDDDIIGVIGIIGSHVLKIEGEGERLGFSRFQIVRLRIGS